jgi:hypothetical protein
MQNAFIGNDFLGDSYPRIGSAEHYAQQRAFLFSWMTARPCGLAAWKAWALPFSSRYQMKRCL